MLAEAKQRGRPHPHRGAGSRRPPRVARPRSCASPSATRSRSWRHALERERATRLASRTTPTRCSARSRPTSTSSAPPCDAVVKRCRVTPPTTFSLIARRRYACRSHQCAVSTCASLRFDAAKRGGACPSRWRRSSTAVLSTAGDGGARSDRSPPAWVRTITLVCEIETTCSAPASAVSRTRHPDRRRVPSSTSATATPRSRTTTADRLRHRLHRRHRPMGARPHGRGAPDKLLCREECSGLRPVCGADLNLDPDHRHEAAD